MFVDRLLSFFLPIIWKRRARTTIYRFIKASLARSVIDQQLIIKIAVERNDSESAMLVTLIFTVRIYSDKHILSVCVRLFAWNVSFMLPDFFFSSVSFCCNDHISYQELSCILLSERIDLYTSHETCAMFPNEPQADQSRKWTSHSMQYSFRHRGKNTSFLINLTRWLTSRLSVCLAFLNKVDFKLQYAAENFWFSEKGLPEMLRMSNREIIVQTVL